jgi:hypothetical protein
LDAPPYILKKINQHKCKKQGAHVIFKDAFGAGFAVADDG